MRNLITIVFVFVSIFTFGQDRELFDYVNTYRVKNGVDAVEWDYTIAEKKSGPHVDSLVSKKSGTGDTTYIFHSENGGWENVVYVGGVGSEKNSTKEFNTFLNKYYNIEPYDPYTVDTTKINTYVKLYMVYCWSESKGHNRAMLMKSHKIMGADTVIEDFTFKDNKITLLGVTKTITSFDPCYEGLSFGVINFE
jgi:hypothetical protein